jgi:hypothetical protein
MKASRDKPDSWKRCTARLVEVLREAWSLNSAAKSVM